MLKEATKLLVLLAVDSTCLRHFHLRADLARVSKQHCPQFQVLTLNNRNAGSEAVGSASNNQENLRALQPRGLDSGVFPG